MHKRIWIVMLVWFLLVGTNAAIASEEDQPAASLAIVDGWVRAVPPVSRATAAYFTIVNPRSEADMLLHVASPIAETVEIHNVIAQPDGTYAMTPVPHIAVPGKTKTSLKPGGYHVMLIGLAKPVKEADRVPVQLIFQKAGKISVSLPVQMTPPHGASASGDDEPQHHHHHH